MPLSRAQQHRAKLEALISAGAGMSEIQKALGLKYAAVHDMIRLLGLPKPVDNRLRWHSTAAMPTVRGTAASSRGRNSRRSPEGT